MQTPSPAQPIVIVLAAGKGARFLASGGAQHKLHTYIGEYTVLEHTLRAVRASGLPFVTVLPEHNPTGGMGDSIAAGVRLCPAAAGWLVLPADLPWIQPATLRAVADALMQADAEQVIVPYFEGQAAHPVGFGAACGADLLALRGEQGAKFIVAKRTANRLTILDAGSRRDVDTVADLYSMADLDTSAS